MKDLVIIDKSYIALEGIQAIVNQMDGSFGLKVLENITPDDCSIVAQADLAIIDYSGIDDSSQILTKLKDCNPELAILAITNKIQRTKILKALKNGVDSHLLKSCGKEEIKEAIVSTIEGKQFFCGQVLDLISEENDREKGCEGVELTEREVEIIKLIAKGYTNKEVAGELNISSHTANTHRKNIMAKLNIKNVAGLVVYAFQEDLLLNS